MQNDETVMDRLYHNWCIAAFEADSVYDELGEDFTHPRFIAAENKSRDLLFKYLRQRTKSKKHIYMKLEMACDYEDFFTDAKDPHCRYVAPHAAVGALQDLKQLVCMQQMSLCSS